MKTLNSTLLGAAMATFVAVFGAGGVEAKTELKVATLAPEGTPWFDWIAEWKKGVEEASNGEIELQIFPSAQLGPELEVWNKVARGRIDVGVFSAAPLTEKEPATALMSTPFLFEKAETVYCVWDTQLGGDFEALLADNFHLISWAENGWVQVYGQDDLSDVNDAEGYKIRVAPHPMSRVMMSSANANGIEIPYADTPAALQTGLVQGGESVGISYVAFGLNKVAPHLTVTNHSHQAGVVLMGKKTWDKLTGEEKRILTEATPPIELLRKGVAGVDAFLIGKHEEGGGSVHRLTDEERAAWKAKVEPNWPTMVKQLGAEAEEMWPKVLAAKEACGE